MFEFEESYIPGIGTRYAVHTRSGDNLVIVVHDSGGVELFQQPAGATDPQPVANLNEDEARHFAAIVGRTIYRPQELERLARTGVGITWFQLPPGAYASGKSLRALNIPDSTGASVVAVVKKSGGIRSSSEEGYELQEGDQAAIVGGPKETKAALDLLEKGPA